MFPWNVWFIFHLRAESAAGCVEAAALSSTDASTNPIFRAVTFRSVPANGIG